MANEQSSRTIRVYRPDSRFSDGPFTALKQLTRELWGHRGHIALIFMRDFRSAYRGTALGVFWAFALPLLPVTVYVFLSVLGVFPAVDNMPRAIFVSFNVTLWLLFAGLIEQPIAVVRSRNAESMKTSLPISVAVASGFATLSFETLLRLVLVAIIVGVMLTPPAATFPLALGVILIGAIFCLSLGLVLAIVNIAIPDTQSIVTIAMRYGIFVSGVIFPLSRIGPLEWLEVINPFAILIHAARDLSFHGALSYPWPLAIVALASIVLALFAARAFYLMEYRIRGIV